MVDIPLVKQRVLSYLQHYGPSVPVQLSKVLGSDSFFAGAILSELLSEKHVKMTTAKLGRSPLYYLPGQENKLEVLYPHLPDKEKEAYQFLKERKLVKDREAVPSIRVAFRMMKDFAVPVTFQTTTGEELYWKWHLASDEELQPLQLPVQRSSDVLSAPEHHPPVLQASPSLSTGGEKAMPFDVSGVLSSYIRERQLTLLEQRVIRKNQEIHGVVRVPSNIGALDVFLVVKSKKKISDTDLAMAQQKGAAKGCMTIFLTNGELTKKAKDHLDKHLKGHVLFHRVP